MTDSGRSKNARVDRLLQAVRQWSIETRAEPGTATPERVIESLYPLIRGEGILQEASRTKNERTPDRPPNIEPDTTENAVDSEDDMDVDSDGDDEEEEDDMDVVADSKSVKALTYPRGLRQHNASLEESLTTKMIANPVCRKVSKRLLDLYSLNVHISNLERQPVRINQKLLDPSNTT